LLPKDEYYLSGRRSCQGCGKALAARIASKTIGTDAMLSGAYSQKRYPLASSLTAQSFSYDSLLYEDMAENLAASIMQINQSLTHAKKPSHKKIKKAVVGVDRRLFINNPLVLSRAFASTEETLFVCFDNEPHIDALIKKALPQAFRIGEKPHQVTAAEVRQIIKGKNIPQEITESGFSYIATACPSFPSDYMAKIKKGLACTGSAFILVLSPCPTGWIFNPPLTVKVGTMAVRTGYFPLYEQEGATLRITELVKTRKPVQEFVKLQKRFFTFPLHLLPPLQEVVDEQYAELLTMHTQ
jgi:pyruvate ferredoxin oxidoreductase beta subunit